jgi:hypothetical protein
MVFQIVVLRKMIFNRNKISVLPYLNDLLIFPFYVFVTMPFFSMYSNQLAEQNCVL